MGTISTKSLNHLMNDLTLHNHTFQLSRCSEDSLGCISAQEGIFELIMPPLWLPPSPFLLSLPFSASCPLILERCL